MKATTIYKGVSAVALGTAMTFGAAFSASALPVFEVTPSVLGGPAGTFMADHLVGDSSTLVTSTSPTTINGMGYLTFTGFTLNGAAVLGSGFNESYGLYATFTYNATLNSGSFGAVNSRYTLNNLAVQLFGYSIPGGTPTYTQAHVDTAGGGPRGGTVAPGAGNVKIGDASLIAGTISTNRVDFDDGSSAGGTTVTTVNTYTNTAFGNTFFTAPSPFYNIAFASITNNLSGIETNPAFPTRLAINATSTSIDFNRASLVPEPGSLALIGLGLVGLFASTRRRSNKSA